MEGVLRGWRIPISLLAVSCLVAGAANGQQPLPTLQANARAVLVDVVVTDAHGHAVQGLTAADFALAEDGVPQHIASFEEIRASAAVSPPPPPLPENTFTNARRSLPAGASTVLLLDALDTPPSAQSYAREQLIKFVATMHPTGPVAIFSLDTQLHLIQGFTADPDELRKAVKDRAKVMETVIPRAPGSVAERFRYDFLTRAFNELGSYLGQFPGRKNLIWFTGSVPLSTYDEGAGLGGSLRDAESFSFDYASSTALLTLGRVSIYPIDAEGLRTDPTFSAERGGVPGHFASERFLIEDALKHEDLMAVANATGGRAFYNTNGIRQAIGEVIETGANYYTLSYTPINSSWNGEYRRLKLTSDVPNAHLEYRQGYYARRETGLPNGGGARRQITNHALAGKPGATAAFAQAMQLGALSPNGIVFQAQVNAPVVTGNAALQTAGQDELATKYRKKPVRDFVVTYTLQGDQIGLGLQPDGMRIGKVDFAVLVLDDQGQMVNSALTTVAMDLKPETYRTLMENGVQMPVQIAVPAKGNFFLRVGVRDASGGKSGVLEIPVGEVKLGVAP